MKERKSYTCNKLGRTLNFLPNRVNFCCSCAEGPNVEYIPNKPLDINHINKAKKSYLKELKFGHIPSKCSGCIEYEEKQYKNIFDFLFSKQDSFLVDEIIVNHFKQCDCNCIYCSQKLIWGNEASQNYQLLPIIKELFNNNAIDINKLKVEFQGGNVSLLEEFEPLMKEFMSRGCRRYSIFTNNIKYLPIIEEAAQNGFVEMHISLDSGTKETFERIKQVDAFDQVLNNIKEYSIKTNAIINLKYIIINGVNDNINEVQKFFDTVRELRCINSVCFDIDYRDILLDKNKNFIVPNHYYDLVNFAQGFCSENRINFSVTPYAKQYMDNHKQ